LEGVYTAFFYELDRNVEVVDEFFSKKSAEMQRRLKLLQDKYGDGTCDFLDWHDVEDLVSSCGEG
jgi:glycerophosphodiester phosphodiesterase